MSRRLSSLNIFRVYRVIPNYKQVTGNFLTRPGMAWCVIIIAVQSTRMQRSLKIILTMSCWYSLDSYR